MRLLPVILIAYTCTVQASSFLPWDHPQKCKKSTSSNESTSALKKLGHYTIRFHQKVLSPADGPRSHFIPSSSAYTYNAITQYGLWRGFLLGADRLMRENGEAWLYPKVDHEYITKRDPVRRNIFLAP